MWRGCDHCYIGQPFVVLDLVAIDTGQRPCRELCFLFVYRMFGPKAAAVSPKHFSRNVQKVCRG